MVSFYTLNKFTVQGKTNSLVVLKQLNLIWSRETSYFYNVHSRLNSSVCFLVIFFLFVTLFLTIIKLFITFVKYTVENLKYKTFYLTSFITATFKRFLGLYVIVILNNYFKQL